MIAVSLLGLLSFVKAGWDFLFCPIDPPSIQNFDATAMNSFAGTWYEIYRDSDHDFWSFQRCPISTYSRTSDRILTLSIDYTNTLWGAKEQQVGTVDFSMSKDAYGFEFFDLVKSGNHQIIMTDYLNYALIYGCNNILGGWLGHYKWATLLSRTKYMGGTHVELVKDKLTEMYYNWGYYWTKPGITCGHDAEATNEENFLAILSTSPTWSYYDTKSKSTLWAVRFFETNSLLPFGILTKNLIFLLQTTIYTPIRTQTTQAKYQEYIYIRDLMDTIDGLILHDIWIITEGLTNEQIEKLQTLAAAKGDNKCCYQNIKDHINGYARHIKKNNDTEILLFREGHFTNSVQDNFGRYVEVFPEIVDPKTKEVTRYLKAYAYTGWWPDAENVGQGIACVWDDLPTINNITQY